MADYHVFGIRHHGPGSARRLLDALNRYQPDCVLIEGPPEADALLELCAEQSMQLPVALLVYSPQHHEHAAYYPFAEFSPEWQAIQYALQQKIAVRFIDLPMTHRFALDQAEAEQAQDQVQTIADQDNEKPNEENTEASTTASTEQSIAQQTPQRDHNAQLIQHIHYDPLSVIAEAAGYQDGEQWWEQFVEERQAQDETIFPAISEMMGTLRQTLDEYDDQEQPSNDIDQREQHKNNLREAYMRKQMRLSAKQYERIAVVCGAWHVPALEHHPKVKDDNALLKGLPKIKTVATWIPWTYGRLSQASGYRAGISSPGWYHHLWQNYQQNSAQWLARVATALRDEGIDVSSAHIIEAVRLADALATLRGRRLAGLSELNEAIRSIMLFGDDSLMQLVQQQCMISERIGQIPDNTPMTPLQQDLQQQQRRLRFKPSATHDVKTLDLRKPTDLARSHLLRRLSLLDIKWGEGGTRGSGKGTFKEEWELQWQPELSLKLIEASRWGHTIQEAAQTYLAHIAQHNHDLPTLVKLAQQALYADLGKAVDELMSSLQNAAALATDVIHLMEVLPDLAKLLRYGDVRNTASHNVEHIVESLVTRICIGLGHACRSLNDEAADALYQHIQACHDALQLLEQETWQNEWLASLQKLTQQSELHPLLAGQACRLLYQSNRWDQEKIAQQFSLALSSAVPPHDAAAWAEGFLRSSGQILIYEESLWQMIDEWLTQLSHRHFQQILPLLRRTFSQFATAERRQMGERVKNQPIQLVNHSPHHLLNEQASLVLPLLHQILGLPQNPSIKQTAS